MSAATSLSYNRGVAGNPNNLVAGRYRKRSLIGRGGAGTVYRALDTKEHREVALKVLRGELVADPVIAARFRREGRAIQLIDHPNITRLLDLGSTADGSLFLVLELVDGPSLADLIDSDGAFPLPRALRILRQIAAALESAHSVGVVHRDLTSSNVGLTTGDQVKVFDFGLAKILGPEQREVLSAPTGYTLGTPEYMAPEQITGEPLDRRVDLYSFGVIAFEVLTGTLPFHGDAVAVFRAHINTEPTPPSRAAGRALPPALDRLVLRCLTKYPEQRFDDAGEILQQLEVLAREP
jgi:serine/threonine-protein kinase